MFPNQIRNQIGQKEACLNFLFVLNSAYSFFQFWKQTNRIFVKTQKPELNNNNNLYLNVGTNNGEDIVATLESVKIKQSHTKN